MRISDWSSDVCSSDLSSIAGILIRGSVTLRPALRMCEDSIPGSTLMREVSAIITAQLPAASSANFDAVSPSHFRSARAVSLLDHLQTADASGQCHRAKAARPAQARHDARTGTLPDRHADRGPRISPQSLGLRWLLKIAEWRSDGAHRQPVLR